MADTPRTWDEIRKHNKKNDCWVVVDNVVYDMTPFLDEHPGGRRLPVKQAGKDATEVWNKIHGHRKEAILKQYAHLRVGVLADAAAPAAAPPPPSPPKAAAATPPPAAAPPPPPRAAAKPSPGPTPPPAPRVAIDPAVFLRLGQASDGTALADASGWWRATSRAFGGQIVAHCVLAAGRRAPKGWACHSCHVQFVAAGKMVETRYEVEPLREGKSLTLFQVRAVEVPSGALVVCATVGFHDVAGERSRGDTPQLCTTTAPSAAPPPTPPPPPTMAAAMPPAMGNTGANWPARKQVLPDGSLWWLGWPAPVPLGSIEQCAALAFLSDLRGAGVAAFAHRDTRRVAMITSLDHTVHFHTVQPQKPLSWVLVQLESPWAADGRALVRMRLWSPDGELLATAVQEAVLRTRPATAADAKPTPPGLAAGLGYDQDGNKPTSKL